MNYNDYEDFTIENAMAQFINPDGTKETAIDFGCVGTLSIESEVVELSKNCGNTRLKSKSVTSYLNLTIEGHMSRTALENIFGLTNEDLKTGVKAIDRNSISKSFILTAEVYDFDRNKKLIAIPNVNNVTGFVKEIDNGATEVPYVELELQALYDKENKLYYEAMETEITDETVKSTWMTAFSPELVKEGI